MMTAKEKKIIYCCDDCEIEANRLTCLKKYDQEPKRKKFEISTYHSAKCDVCGEMKMVTEKRVFFYPDFNLLISSKTNKDD